MFHTTYIILLRGLWFSPRSPSTRPSTDMGALSLFLVLFQWEFTSERTVKKLQKYSVSIRGQAEYILYAGYTLKPKTSLRELDLDVVKRLTNQHSSIMSRWHCPKIHRHYNWVQESSWGKSDKSRNKRNTILMEFTSGLNHLQFKVS